MAKVHQCQLGTFEVICRTGMPFETREIFSVEVCFTWSRIHQESPFWCLKVLLKCQAPQQTQEPVSREREQDSERATKCRYKMTPVCNQKKTPRMFRTTDQVQKETITQRARMYQTCISNQTWSLDCISTSQEIRLTQCDLQWWQY